MNDFKLGKIEQTNQNVEETARGIPLHVSDEISNLTPSMRRPIIGKSVLRICRHWDLHNRCLPYPR